MGVYKWKSHYFKASAEAVADELRNIDATDTQSIVDFAMDENTELHKCFTWDDTAAAKSWRKYEARQIVQSLVIVADSEEGEPVMFRVFESVKTESGKSHFVETVTALDDEMLRAQIFGEIYAGIKELQHKAKVYRDLADNEMAVVDKQLQLAAEAVPA